MQTNANETRKIFEIVENLKSSGYTVVVEPTGQELPESLTEIRPDLIAVKGDEKLVIEVISVRTANSHRKKSHLKRMAEIARQAGWEFQVVTVPGIRKVPDDEAESTEESPPTKKELEERIEKLDKLIQLGETEAAFLLTWATFEGVLRYQLKEELSSQRVRNSRELLKAATVFGVLSRRDLSTSERLLTLRNEVAHGLKTSVVSQEEAEKFVELIKRTLSEN